jgi:molybdopterin-guanine dinucleotide biosynthesis protein A
MEKIDGRTLLQRVIESLSLLGGEIIVVIAKDQPEPISSSMTTKVIVDIYAGKSAMGGIYTGLVASNSPYSLVVGCDMPLLNSALLRYLIQLAPGFDAVIPMVDGNMEALHAVYSKNCLAAIEHQLEQGNLKVIDLPSQLKVRFVEEEEINRFDPEHLSFFNINTQADLKRAKALLQRTK